MKRGLVFGIILGVLLIINLTIISAACASPDQTIMKLYSATNAHGALWNQSYTYDVCYSGTAPANPHNCKAGNTNAVLWLNSINNSHASTAQITGYNIPVCYGDLNCTARQNSCNAGEQMIISLYQTNNSHISNASDTNYLTKICCKEMTQANVYWANMMNSPITTAHVGDTVKLFFNSSGLDSKEINYTIWRAIPFWWDKKIAQGSSQGYTTWVANVADTFYFKAKIVGETDEYTSGSLTVSGSNNFPPSTKIITPVTETNYIKSLITGKTNNILFTQQSSDEDDDLKVLWDFGDGISSGWMNNCLTNGTCNTNYQYNFSGTKNIIVTAREMTRNQEAKNYSRIYVYQEGLNVIVIMDKKVTGKVVEINASRTHVANCNNTMQKCIDMEAIRPGGACYIINDTIVPAQQLFCYDVALSVAGIDLPPENNNLIFSWKFDGIPGVPYQTPGQMIYTKIFDVAGEHIIDLNARFKI